MAQSLDKGQDNVKCLWVAQSIGKGDDNIQCLWDGTILKVKVTSISNAIGLAQSLSKDHDNVKSIRAGELNTYDP